MIADTIFVLSSVSKSSSSPTLLSSSFIAATILDLSVVSKLVISPCFLPTALVAYSAPKTSALLSACKSTSLIASTTVFLLSVVNWILLSPEAELDKLPIWLCNSFFQCCL